MLIFKQKKIIPEFCFGCYKVQVEVDSIIELIKLFLVFNQLKLENNLLITQKKRSRVILWSTSTEYSKVFTKDLESESLSSSNIDFHKLYLPTKLHLGKKMQKKPTKELERQA